MVCRHQSEAVNFDPILKLDQNGVPRALIVRDVRTGKEYLYGFQGEMDVKLDPNGFGKMCLGIFGYVVFLTVIAQVLKHGPFF